MYDKQIRPDRKVTFYYIRVCEACGHKEPYEGDDQKCESCQAAHFRVEK